MKETGYRVPYAYATYGKEEREAVIDVLDHPERLVGGPYTNEMEDRIADQFGKEVGVMVNSGSSANLLAIELLDLEPGAEVITPLVTFSTTVTPLVQNDLVPVFVDVGLGDYQINLDQVSQAISEETEAIMVPSLLGNVPDYPALLDVADDHGLYLVEDSADTLGATINGTPTGEFTHVSTTSFYGSHVITSFGAGGMVCVNDPDWADRLKKLRGWGRASAVGESDDIDERLSTELDGTPYDSKFVFDELGYNFLPTEASAAFGAAQLDKLNQFRDIRQRHFSSYFEFFQEYEEWFHLPETSDEVETCWLAFPLTLTDDAPFDRKSIVRHLERNGVQTRSLWSGNLLKHPGFAEIDARLPIEEYENADRIMEDAFVIGAHQGMNDDDVRYVTDTLVEFFDEY
jgi:CDP-6-deoxy-D-xylo-4-hexulose-3-dehydrase